MTTLLTLILIALIVLIILVSIGVFKIRDIRNYCDYIPIERYHSQGTLNSINSTLSEILISQGTTIREHLKALYDAIMLVNNRLEEIRDNTTCESDDVTIDFDLPFPEDECENKSDSEREHFILTNDTTSEDIKKAYIDGKIAIHCTSKKEWKESIAIVSEVFQAKTRHNDTPDCNEKTMKGFAKGNDFHCMQETPLYAILFLEEKRGKFFVQGILDDCDVTDDYDVIDWANIRGLFIDSIEKSTDDIPTKEKDESIIEDAGAILRDVRDKKLAEGETDA